MNDDDQLFSQEMANVRPLASDKRVVYLKNSGHPAVKNNVKDEPEQPENTFTTGFLDIVPSDEPLEFKQDGIQQGVLDKLRAGKYPLEASINLLKKPVETCRQELFSFLYTSQNHNLRTLLIIHGRGRNDQGHANIVRSYVAKWLKQLDEVQAFSVALQRDGGAGACYVVLKKTAQAKQENWERHAKRSR